MAERYFSREEAEGLLPGITERLRQALERKEDLDELDREHAQAAARIMVLGGSAPPHAALARNRDQRARIVSQITEMVSKIQEAGCVVKDLDEGLVDFPSLIEGREAYLCWKLGEERIGYWHGLDEGFAGRKPLASSESEGPDAPLQ